jgi:large subunit ribosomal protein L10
MAETKTSKVPEGKIKAVKDLAEKMKTAKTIMIVSNKGVPSPQFQKIKKDLREKAQVNVIKKNILLRAIDEIKVPEMDALKEHVQADSAVALSQEDAFELAGWLTENRNPIAAKQGQEATDDIDIEPGPTDLMPGPDISALGAVGLKVAVEEGKIAIKAPHTVLKAGEKVTPEVASVLQKLDIKPFMIGLTPLVVYDSEAKKIYVGIKIDKEEALNNLLTAAGKALGLAQGLSYTAKETIGYLLAKANAEMQALENNLSSLEKKTSLNKEETKEAESAEEAKETPEPTTEPEQKDSNKEQTDNSEVAEQAQATEEANKEEPSESEAKEEEKKEEAPVEEPKDETKSEEVKE